MTLLEEFKRYLETEKQYSPNTVRNYVRCIEDLFETIGHRDPFKVTFKEARQWVVKLGIEGKEPQTVRSYVLATKPFFKYLMIHHKLGSNPLAVVPTPKVRKKLRKFVAEPDITRFFEEEFSDDWDGIRDRFVIYLLYTTGIRADELVNMRIADVNLKRNEVKVTGKGDKQRVIPIANQEEFNKMFSEYMDARLQRKNVFHKWLIISDQGRKAYYQMIRNICNSALKKMNTEARGTHAFRHSLATHLINAGADVMAIKDLLGHESVITTQIYTQVYASKLVKEHNKVFNR